MVKNLHTRLVAGVVTLGLTFTLSGCKAGYIKDLYLRATTPVETPCDLPEVSAEIIYETPEPEIEETEEPVLEEPVVEEPIQTPFEIKDNYLIPAVRTIASVNVRSDSNTDSEVYGVLNVGEVLPVYSKLDNGWYAVNYNGQTGYVCGDYVKETYIINKEVLYNGCLNKDTYIYDEVGNVIANVPWLELVKIYGEDNSRYFVQFEDIIGYLSKEDVTILTGTYAVVDISDQRLDLYNNTNIILTTPVVTGKDSTPSDLGLFDIDSKGRNVILKGADYETHVNYWMPYNGGEGLHDAVWREYFGGDIYIKNGSHGCINMPLDKVQEAYNDLYVGSLVLVKR